jgi:hypothetical protein
MILEKAWSLNNPLKIFAKNTGNHAFLNIDSKYPVVIEAIKQAETGLNRASTRSDR